ncbi:MAG TPA: GNAT family N-acetyltransferase [Candidatus Bathyarchaeia archaeon]|nr:GNAT family N-acetyltransferase [Candidatus Bathyarchaeia archaeon]
MNLPEFLKKDWMKKVDIRLSVEEEAPRLTQIIVEAYTPIEPILGRKPRGMLETEEKVLERIAEKAIYSVLFDNELVGTFTIKRSKEWKYMEVQKVAIKAEMQNKGLGSYLMESAEHLIRLMEEKKVIIQTYADHKQLVDFYLHRGYKVIDQMERKGNIVCIMEKKLWRED